MAHSLLLYTLLALWLLPAVALIVVYCADVVHDKLRRLWVRWTYYRARKALSTYGDPQSIIALRRSVVVSHHSQTAPWPVSSRQRAVHGSDSARPYLVMGDSMRVPLMLEDEAGELHMQQWELSLN